MIPYDAPSAGDILGAMITPAVLISASGTLTMSTSNRLGRIVDRVRGLHSEAEKLPPWDATDQDALERRALIADQIARQAQRISILQTTLIVLYLAIGLLVAASFSIGLSVVASGWFSWLPVILGLLGSMALFTGAILLIREARLAVRSSLSELEFIKRMVARRTGAPLPSPKPVDIPVQAESPPESSG